MDADIKENESFPVSTQPNAVQARQEWTRRQYEVRRSGLMRIKKRSTIPSNSSSAPMTKPRGDVVGEGREG